MRYRLSFLVFLSVLFILSALSARALADDAQNQTIRPGLQRIYDSCTAIPEMSERTKCLEPYFIGLTDEVSAGFAVHRAKEMKDAHVIDDCHMIAHMVGKANLYKYNYDLGKALGTCSLECIQGCVHGSVQNYIAEKIDIHDLKKELKKICDSVNDDPLLRRQCVHGVGHGFLTHGYLPVEEALAACNEFKGAEVNTCLGGLFMENMQKYELGTEEELKKDLPDVCAAIEKIGNPTYTSYCYDAVGEGLMFYTAHNLPRSIELCPYSTADKKNLDTCYRGAIMEAANTPDMFKDSDCDAVPAPLKPLCKTMLGSQQPQ